MFKLVVLFAVAAVAVAKPGYLHDHYPVIAAPIVQKVIAPAAVSHTYRKDIISEPIIAHHAHHAVPVVPVIQKVVAPIAVAPAAVSHTYRKDIISEPVIAHHAVPVVAAPAISYAAHVPSHYGLHGLHGLHGNHYGYGHGW